MKHLLWLVVLLLGAGVAPAQTETPAPVAAPTRKPKAQPFFLDRAPAVADLKAGGFATEPSFMDGFAPDWPQRDKDWDVATWKQNKTEMSPERCKTNAEGHLVQTVLPGAPARGGSLQTAREFGYDRWLARLRPSAVPGVLNSMFTNGRTRMRFSSRRTMSSS